GQDASGEAIFVDNPAKNKAIISVYQRDPSEKRPLPGPLPPARVENDEKTILATGGAGFIVIKQATDQAWVEGPGMLVQLTARAPGSPSTTSVSSNAPDSTDATPHHISASHRSDQEMRRSPLRAQTSASQGGFSHGLKPGGQISQSSLAQTASDGGAPIQVA